MIPEFESININIDHEQTNRNKVLGIVKAVTIDKILFFGCKDVGMLERAGR